MGGGVTPNIGQSCSLGVASGCSGQIHTLPGVRRSLRGTERTVPGLGNSWRNWLSTDLRRLPARQPVTGLRAAGTPAWAPNCTLVASPAPVATHSIVYVETRIRTDGDCATAALPALLLRAGRTCAGCSASRQCRWG